MLATGSQPERDRAIARITSRRRFSVNLGTYAAVNVALVLIWAATREDGDPFWPVWPIALWGIGVLGQAWHVYGSGSGPVSDAAIDREMRRRASARRRGPASDRASRCSAPRRQADRWAPVVVADAMLDPGRRTPVA